MDLAGGDLPAKNSYARFASTQNPFSPEYDKLGFGRIEISQARYRQIPGFYRIQLRKRFLEFPQSLCGTEGAVPFERVERHFERTGQQARVFHLNLFESGRITATSSAL